MNTPNEEKLLNMDQDDPELIESRLFLSISSFFHSIIFTAYLASSDIFSKKSSNGNVHSSLLNNSVAHCEFRLRNGRGKTCLWKKYILVCLHSR